MLKILTKEEYEIKIKGFKSEAYHLSQSGEWNNVQSLNFPDQVRFVYQNTDGYDLVIGRVVKSRILKAFNVLQLNYGPVIKVGEIKARFVERQEPNACTGFVTSTLGVT